MIKYVLVAFVFLSLTASGCNVSNSQKPNIVLIIIDTLRADHLGCYGYYRNTSPVIDSLAASGIVFTRCQAQAPWTLPAHATIWTGLTVRSHRTVMLGTESYGLNPEFETISTILGANGYITLGFVNSPYLAEDFGFNRGFDHYSMHLSGHGLAAVTVDEVLKWFEENTGNPSPKLLVVHLFDVHAPYSAPGGFDLRFSETGSAGGTNWQTDSLNNVINPEDLQHLVNMYDGEIAWVDSQIGRLLQGLRRYGVLDNAMVIVTSDHGEEFFDHGSWSHGHSLYQELLHVPLIITGAGIPSDSINTIPAGQFDLLPVIAGYTGNSVPECVEGMDILSGNVSSRILPSSGAIRGVSGMKDFDAYESLCSILYFPGKGIINYSSMEEEFYDIADDPGETMILPLGSPICEMLDEYWTTPPLSTPVRSDCGNLESLGYIR